MICALLSHRSVGRMRYQDYLTVELYTAKPVARATDEIVMGNFLELLVSGTSLGDKSGKPGARD